MRVTDDKLRRLTNSKQPLMRSLAEECLEARERGLMPTVDMAAQLTTNRVPVNLQDGTYVVAPDGALSVCAWSPEQDGRGKPGDGTEPLLDPRGRTTLLDKIAELREPGRVEDIGEIEMIEAHLSRVSGLAGQTRLFGDETDKARKAASGQVKTAIDSIRKAGCPKLAEHLHSNIRRGRDFSYEPQQERQVGPDNPESSVRNPLPRKE